MKKNYQQPKTAFCKLTMATNMLVISNTPGGGPSGEFDGKSKKVWDILEGDDEWEVSFVKPELIINKKVSEARLFPRLLLFLFHSH